MSESVDRPMCQKNTRSIREDSDVDLKTLQDRLPASLYTIVEFTFFAGTTLSEQSAFTLTQAVRSTVVDVIMRLSDEACFYRYLTGKSMVVRRCESELDEIHEVFSVLGERMDSARQDIFTLIYKIVSATSVKDQLSFLYNIMGLIDDLIV